MRPSTFIAGRYLFSRKKKSVINVISWISLVGIAVGTAALIVVLSVYNGIGELTQELFNVFDPELKIEPAQGKTFHTDSIAYEQLCSLDGVDQVSALVEENAWITHKHNEAIVQLRGVDDNYHKMTGLDTMLYEGNYCLRNTFETVDPNDETCTIEQQANYLIFGGEIYYNLGISTYANSLLTVNIPKRGSGIGMTMSEAFNTGHAYSAGCFYLQQDIDNRYVVAHADFVRQLMDYDEDEVTALAISLKNPRHLNKVKEQIKALVGDNYQVRDRFEQQPLYYKVFQSERLGVMLVLSLIVLIATLNLIASLSLLIIDKRKDIHTLRSMGMDNSDLRRTFFTEGIMIALVGIVAGLVVGFIICWVQQQFGIIKMGANFITDAFPVSMRWQDFVNTLLIVLVLSFLAVTFTIKKARIGNTEPDKQPSDQKKLN